MIDHHRRMVAEFESEVEYFTKQLEEQKAALAYALEMQERTKLCKAIMRGEKA